MNSLLITLLLLFATSDFDPKIVEIIKDAQATNRALLQSGALNFDVTQTLTGKRPVHAKGTFTWKGDDGLWAYRLGDPDHIMTSREDLPVEVSDAPVQYMLLTGDRIYVYDSSANQLVVNKVEHRGGIFTSFWITDLFPATLWSQCCPPFHGSGRPWVDMLGPKSPAAWPGSTYELTRISPTVYRQVRLDTDKGRGTMDLSMEFAGNVIANDYEVFDQKSESSHTRYVWEKSGRAVVLKSCESKRMMKEDPTQAAMVFTASFDRVDIATPVPVSKFAFEEFSKLLPRSTMVLDQIKNKTYPLHKSNVPPDDLFKDLIKKAHSNGFSSEGKP